MKEIVSYDPARKAWIGMTGPDGPHEVGKAMNNSHITKRTTTIHNTVREAQDILCRLSRTIDYGPYPKGHHQFGNKTEWPVVKWPVQYPQSLGELCLELAQDKLRNEEKHKFASLTYKDGPTKREMFLTLKGRSLNLFDRLDLHASIQALRLALYNRHA